MTTPDTDVRRSLCPIATTLDFIGDKWSLIIIRDMMTGKKRFNQFMTSPERITTNILTARLNSLEQAGLIDKQAYHKRPLRFEYSLTAKGAALLPVLQEISRWANTHIPGTWVPPEEFMRAVSGHSRRPR